MRTACYVFGLLVILLGGLVSAQPLANANDTIEVLVNRDDGRFTMGAKTGHPLLAGYPSDYSVCHFNFRMDAATYSNDPGAATMMTPSETLGIAGTSLYARWRFSEIQVWQEITVYQGDTPDEDSLYGMAQYQIFVYNGDTIPHSFGMAMYLDLDVDGNNNPQVISPYRPFTPVAVETMLTATQVPPYFMYFHDAWDTAPNRLGLIYFEHSVGTFPDKVIIGDAANLRTVTWGYTPTYEPITDAAMFIQWQAANVDPYNTRAVSFYMGVGFPSMWSGVRPEPAPIRAQPLEVTSVSPNPWSDRAEVTLNAPGDFAGAVNVAIYDLAGTKVSEREAMLYPGFNRISLERGTLPAGTYLLRVTSGQSEPAQARIVITG